jgi:anaerobic magnesium-protoporphyrin IX monomethyl ester cyclase
LERIEDIMYFETDSSLTQEQVLAYGKMLRESFYGALPGFADSIDLVDEEGLYPLHADFCSRLAMTFTHGDYARIEGIRDKDRLAEKLYTKALRYHPDHRAYLGLGILHQKKQEYALSARFLLEGLQHFPRSRQLRLCLGISRMNLGRFTEALSCFDKCHGEPEVERLIAACKQALKK